MTTRSEVEEAERDLRAIVDRRNQALEDLQIPGISDETWQAASKRFLDASADLKRADRRLANLLSFYNVTPQR